MATTDKAATHWQIDRKIPIALIIALLAQFGGAVYAVARFDNRVTILEMNDARVDTLIASRMKVTDEKFEAINRERDRVIRIESQVQFMVEAMKRIEDKLNAR